MMKKRQRAVLFGGLLSGAGAAPQGPRTAPFAQESYPMSLYSFTVTDIDGNAVPLARYQGRVLLIVNEANYI